MVGVDRSDTEAGHSWCAVVAEDDGLVAVPVLRHVRLYIVAALALQLDEQIIGRSSASAALDVAVETVRLVVRADRWHGRSVPQAERQPHPPPGSPFALASFTATTCADDVP